MTVLNATRYVHASTGLVGARLDVTAAPEPPATVYASNFTLMSMDGWTIVSGAGWLTVDGVDVPYALDLEADGATVQAGRDITGLTIGATYRFSVDVKRNNFGMVSAVVEGIGGTGYMTPSTISYTTLVKEFTATATTHRIKVAISSTGGSWAADPKILFRNATVYGPVGSWQGTTIVRTDDNGTAQVRNPRGYDTHGGDLSLIDYDAALTGTISYTVTDGLGATATDTVTAGLPSDKTWISLPATGNPGNSANPALSVPVEYVTRWDEQSAATGQSYQVIGRTDRAGNPGPLATRTGSFDALCLTYADVEALRGLLEDGDVALLRQPTHAGLDLYFTTRAIRASIETDALTWTVTVDYDEVPSP